MRTPQISTANNLAVRNLDGLNGSRFARRAAMAVVAVHTVLLGWSADRQSPTYNEAAHLVAGVSYWKLGRFDVYCVNPPLTRLVAALPVLAANPKTDWRGFFEEPGARPEFEMGKDFVAINGERSLWLFTIARWACLPFSWLGSWICFRWARDLYGSMAGLLAVALWCFDPNVLAHSQLVTPDAGATALGLAASYSFWKWLRAPGLPRAGIAGLVLGLAELTKFTWLVLFAFWPVIWAVCSITNGIRPTPLRAKALEAAQLLFVIFPVAIYVVNIGYGFEGSCQSLRKFAFVSQALTETTMERRAVAQTSTNRFAKSWAGDVPVALPRNFVVGLDLQKRDLEHLPRLSYLRGKFQDHGWWYFYLYGLVIKVPIGTWLLLLFGIVVSIRRRSSLPTWRDTLCLLAPAFAVLVLVSSQTAFSIHFRYVLPMFPFIFIWISRVASILSLRRCVLSNLAIPALTWAIASSLSIYPHSLSYFNELVGGPNRGQSHMLDSNIDWGQDLLFLRDWLIRHPEARPVNLAYYGYFNPADLGFEFQFSNTLLMPATRHGLKPPLNPGWYAMSVQFLRGAAARIPLGDGTWGTLSPDAGPELLRTEPAGQAGYSIFVFHVSQ